MIFTALHACVLFCMLYHTCVCKYVRLIQQGGGWRAVWYGVGEEREDLSVCLSVSLHATACQ
jgi:hypothetical protein